MARRNVREQIVEAGLKALLEKGFNGCGVQEITEAAGVPKGSFYNHFESKEALGAEIVERFGQDGTRRTVLTDRSIPALDRLRRYFTELNEVFAGLNYTCGCLLGNFSAELSEQSPLIRERLAVVFACWTSAIEAAIKEAQADGSISTKQDAGVLAVFLLDAYEGAILRARVEKDRRAFDAFMRVAFDKVLT